MPKTETISDNLQHLATCLKVIAGRQTDRLSYDSTLDLAEGVDLADAKGTECFVFALREIRRAILDAERLTLTLPARSTRRREILEAVRLAAHCLGDRDNLAAAQFEAGDFADATATAAEAIARIDRDATSQLMKFASELDAKSGAARRPHFLSYLSAYSNREAAGVILAEIGV